MSTWTNHSRRYTDRAPFMARMICAYYRNREYVHDFAVVAVILGIAIAAYTQAPRLMAMGGVA